MQAALGGGRFADPRRHGATVVRRCGPASANVHALLRHFERVGFDLAPRFLGTTEDGQQEVLSYIEGQTGYPPLSSAQRSDEALVSVARAVRAMHDATQTFEPVAPLRWHGYEVALPADTDCVGHHDLAPWNVVFDGTEVVGLLDWDVARPSSRAWDLCYAAHQFVPFHPPDGLAGFGWTEEPDRAARLRLFAEEYGAGIEPPALVDLAVVRLTAMAAYIEERVRAADPAFAVHRQENHARGYRSAACYIASNRQQLLAE